MTSSSGDERAAPSSSAPSSRRLAMILSGGGARGAYEVGVLSYVFDDLTRVRGGPPRIDILSGTSVGAINACYVAAHLADPVLGAAPPRPPLGGARATRRCSASG